MVILIPDRANVASVRRDMGEYSFQADFAVGYMSGVAWNAGLDIVISAFG